MNSNNEKTNIIKKEFYKIYNNRVAAYMTFDEACKYYSGTLCEKCISPNDYWLIKNVVYEELYDIRYKATKTEQVHYTYMG